MRLPVLPIVFLFIFSFLIDLYISADVRSIGKKKGAFFYWFSAALCYALLIVTICLPKRDATSGITAAMWMLFTYFSIYIGKLAYMIMSLVGRLLTVGFRRQGFNMPFRWIGVFLGVAFMAIMWIGSGYTRSQVMVIEQDVYSEKLPASFEGYRIAQISDLHVGTWGEDTSFVQSLVETVNNLRPDLIVLTGDIVNRETGEIEPFIKVLSQLNAKDGVYSILGNHDYGDYVDWDRPEDRDENNRLLAKHQKDMGWILLNNERIFITNGKDSIMLLGVENWGDPPFPIYGDLDKALPVSSDSLFHQNDSTFKLLLSHNPEHWNLEVSKKTNIDLTLSGHTHAMQAIVKFGDWKWSPAKYRYKLWGGKFMRENENGVPTQIYVNTGAGAVGMPARLMAAFPEVTLLTLKRGKPRD